MKGIVFTEFIEMVEDRFGFEVADKILTSSDLPSGGHYTSVGTYDHSEMVTLTGALSSETGATVPQLLHAYGVHLFGRFAEAYGAFFKNVNDSFTFLEQIEGYIHVEVRKLYPDAELPSFQTERVSDHELVMIYRSERRMGDFAHGLIEGCGKYFNEALQIAKEPLDPRGSRVKFVITR